MSSSPFEIRYYFCISVYCCVSLMSCNKKTQITPDAGTSSSIPNLKKERCEVIIAGGSTAALAAALSSAAEGFKTCLLEPTNWPGGQLTASGVSAVDWAWHSVQKSPTEKIEVAKLNRDPRNNASVFMSWMNDLGTRAGRSNPGQCWVSLKCYEPTKLIEFSINASIEHERNLKVYLNTVVKKISSDGRKIVSLLAINRNLVSGQPVEYTYGTANELDDWYSHEDSDKFTKQTFEFAAPEGKTATFIDATEWGELLPLAGASYVQGIEKSEKDPFVSASEKCGQAIVYPLAIEWSDKAEPIPEFISNSKIPYPKHYAINEPQKTFTWNDVWTYRRIARRDPVADKKDPKARAAEPMPGDISMQNWTLGNDYPYRYLFLSRAETAVQRKNWQGGIDIRAIEEAERHAYGWFKWLREKYPDGENKNLMLSRNEGSVKGVFDTGNGLAKLPYIRDTRRSVGNGNFMLKYYEDLLPGVNFEDSIGIGAYVPDVHPSANCTMPPHISSIGDEKNRPLPFYLPFRAHTNKDFDNLLVAGKTMAQTFAANAATRLHPIEFNSGTGAGVAAGMMYKMQISSSEISRNQIPALRTAIKKYAPVEYTK